MNGLEVVGYSERGMINALCYEMKYSRDGLKLLREFLRLCTFPHSSPDFDHFRFAKFFVEQSFSDFGDLDLLILLQGDCNQAVCIEAKVKTFQSNWSVQLEWAKFKDAQRYSECRSNLFVQLYRKMRLLRKLQNASAEIEGDILSRRWSLGRNAIVQRAAEELSEHCSKTWLVALVPDEKDGAEMIFRTAVSCPPQGFPDWSHATMGYLTWQQLEAHCREHAEDWPNTLANFEFNRGQIFGATSAAPPAPGSRVIWNSSRGPQVVVVKNRGRHNTRVRFADGHDEKVPNAQLFRTQS